ncbi:MAG: hypothetical protein LBT96_01450 [Campylobacteraceae bacterium]|nr:hypothetical protein [Campylobacteraceae bacterium]
MILVVGIIIFVYDAKIEKAKNSDAQDNIKAEQKEASKLIECPDCSKEVSRNAYKYPHCGATIKKSKRTLLGKIVLWIFVIFNLFMIHRMSGVLTYNFQSGIITKGVAFWIVMLQWAIGMVVLGAATYFTRAKAK